MYMTNFRLPHREPNEFDRVMGAESQDYLFNGPILGIPMADHLTSVIVVDRRPFIIEVLSDICICCVCNLYRYCFFMFWILSLWIQLL